MTARAVLIVGDRLHVAALGIRPMTRSALQLHPAAITPRQAFRLQMNLMVEVQPARIARLWLPPDSELGMIPIEARHVAKRA